MNFIVACDIRYGIGLENRLPNWTIKGDLKRFKELTIGEGNNVVIMGKNTFLSLPNGPLKNRYNIVISSSLIEEDGYKVARNFTEAYSLANDYISDKNGQIWIIGGSSIYEEAIKSNLISEGYITKLDEEYNCDIYLGPVTIQWISKNKSNIVYFNPSNQ